MQFMHDGTTGKRIDEVDAWTCIGRQKREAAQLKNAPDFVLRNLIRQKGLIGQLRRTNASAE